MANLVIKNSTSTKSYPIKTSYNSTPHLHISNGYLDLTTATQTGLQLKVKEDDVNYRVLQSTSTSIGTSGRLYNNI